MQPGEALGSFRIHRELGSGGMGRVYAATGPLGEVALKVVHPHLLEGGDAAERFRREVEIGRTVEHPNVVRTFDGGEIDGRHYLAMEYVEGQTLDALREELDRVPEELCRHIGREVCRGLGAIHAAGAVHRDIKPENVLITADHVVKIMDLGVARSTDDALRLSQTGAFVGSLHYAAPEQFTGGGKDLDGRVDLHALGLVLYELATGVSPYFADDVPQTIRKVLHEEPRRLGEVNPQLSAFFEEVVHCLLAKPRDERFADAEALLGVLESGEESDWWRDRAASLQLATARPIRRVRIPRETAVYGRETELATLRGLFERAKSGDGNVVLVEGEAGIGKSRLVDELIGQLQRDGEEIDFLYGGYPPGGAATADGAFSKAYREQFGAAGSAAYLPENQILVPAFDALLRGEGPPPDAQPLNKSSLQTCFVRATQSLAADRVVVVLIDDLHFAPEEGRALFTSLAMGVAGHRVLLVGTTRPGVPEEWQAGLTRLAQTSHLSLARLGPKDLFRLLEDTLRSEQLAHDLSGQIAVKSDGNPFFVFEIVRGLREGQFLTQQADGSWVTTRVIAEIEIPSSVLDLVNARVADLSDEEREMLEVAACCGFEFDPALLADVCGMPVVPALKQLGRIERKHRLVRAAGRTFAFDHHQVQEALYHGLHETLREHYHASIADALAARASAAERDPETLDGALCVELAEHYLKGARGEVALRYVSAAQAHLTAGYLHAQAVALLERVLSVPGLVTGVERVDVLGRLANALEMPGPLSAMRRIADQAVELADAEGDVALRAGAHRLLGHVLERCGDNDEAVRELELARGLAREAGDRSIESEAMNCLGAVYVDSGRLADAEASFRQLVERSREVGDRSGEARYIGNLGIVFAVQQRWRDARETFERHLALTREIEDRFGEANASGNLGNVLRSQGHLPAARERIERHLALSREMGNRLGAINAMGNLGVVCKSEGHLVEARDLGERALAMSRECGDRKGEAHAELALASVRIEAEEHELAEEHLGACMALCEELGLPQMRCEAHAALGSSRIAAGDLPGGREALEAARDAAAEQGFIAIETLARCHLARLPGGDVPGALAAFAEHEERLSAQDRQVARFLLWKATGDRAHLEAAKSLLDEQTAILDEDARQRVLTTLCVPRWIIAACAAEGVS